MQEQNQTRIRETLNIKKFDKTHDDNPKEPFEVTVSDRTYDRDRNLLSSTQFSVPGWIGEWSLHNANLIATPEGVVYPRDAVRRTKVALVGFQSEYVPPVIFDDPTWEIWGCNSLWQRTRDGQGRFRADRWFEMHPLSVQTPVELQRMKECPVPLYVLEWTQVEREMRAAVPYPLDQILHTIYPFPYFTCTFAYQLALAIAEGFQEIGVFGMELMFGTARERLFERACLEFWLGMAYGRRISIRFHKNTRLCKHPFKYGYDYQQEKDYCDGKVDLLAHHAIMAVDGETGMEDWHHRISELRQAETNEYTNEG